MADEIVTFPVSAWQIQTVPAHDAVLVRFAFLSHQMQRLEEADPGRNYALTSAQARELIGSLERALRALENAGPQKPAGAGH